MSKSGRQGTWARAGEPRRPAWREKLRRLIEEARDELEAEEKAPWSKGNPT